MIADKIKNARTILYYITNAQCSFGGRQCDYSGSGSISASKGMTQLVTRRFQRVKRSISIRILRLMEYF